MKSLRDLQAAADQRQTRAERLAADVTAAVTAYRKRPTVDGHRRIARCVRAHLEAQR